MFARYRLVYMLSKSHGAGKFWFSQAVFKLQSTPVDMSSCALNKKNLRLWWWWWSGGGRSGGGGGDDDELKNSGNENEKENIDEEE